MYSKDCRTFKVKKAVPVEGWQLKDSLKGRLEGYVSKYLGENIYCDVPLVSENRREIMFSITFPTPQTNVNDMERIVDCIVNTVCSEMKSDGERLNTEKLKKLIEIRVEKYRKE